MGEIISRAELQEYPTLDHALADKRDVEHFPADAVNLQLTPRQTEKIYRLVQPTASETGPLTSSQD